MNTFSFKKFEIEEQKLKYTFIATIEGIEHVFPHTIEAENFKYDPSDPNVIRYAFYIGMSFIPYYYSYHFAPELIIEAAAPENDSLSFFNKYYLLGLAELMYKNGIPFSKFPKIKINSTQPLPPRKPVDKFSNEYLVSNGGGKDSLVTGELLAKADIRYSWFTMGFDSLRVDVVKRAIDLSPIQKNFLVNQRPHPPKFAREYNKKFPIYRGHKPMNAYLAFLGSFVAYANHLKGYIVSNQASANVGNLILDGIEVNHQYSKSFAFEEDVRQFFSDYLPQNIDYFSLLRPLSEIKIAEIFSRHDKYLKAFISCNKGLDTGEWCGTCAKCAFLFLVLSAIKGTETTLSIFKGQNLLEDDSLYNTYLELLGLEGNKPFDCVGEIDEVRYFMYLLHQRGATGKVLDVFKTKLLNNVDFETLYKKYSSLNKNHFIPPDIFERVYGNLK